MTQRDYEDWLAVTDREGSAYGEAAFQRYVRKFGDPPLALEDMGGWDEAEWKDAWEEIDREHDLAHACRMPREVHDESDIPEEYMAPYNAARAASYDALLPDDDGPTTTTIAAPVHLGRGHLLEEMQR